MISIYPAVNGQSHRTIPTTWPYNIQRYNNLYVLMKCRYLKNKGKSGRRISVHVALMCQ